MVKRYRKNRSSTLNNSARIMGSAKFSGEKKIPECSFQLSKLPKSFLNVGELVELQCETPLESAVDSYKLIKSVNRPTVMASKDGKFIMIVSSDKIGGKVDINPDNPIVKDAAELYRAFHGTEVDKIKKVDTADTEVLVFWGYLNHVVYSVPPNSERRGVPFIHEAKDRGDDVPPADEKPIVCVSPKRDFLIMYGPQFVFTERGMIG
jgi:hypothetical protein